ncbi:hypothetical protein [Streptomyces sp. CBMA152]|uniref:hypothetical protein n=1 Tax=Streptomyces sp. CBMA152 TaxID=1896312 RepID=UPI0016610C5D|nr:hypothetical protein [Streptomyces sp. CBMA152]MBD0747420.1 hypothetical protein [Streptomyces sp. CBMA152]
MRAYGSVRAVLAVSAALLLTAGCQRAAGGPAERVPPAPSKATFLGPGACAAHGQAFTEVPCTSERAVARVSVRRAGTAHTAAGCPLNTDFVLYIDGRATAGYACMRNLEAPHPGDPGMGGGPFTVVGDCVYQAGEGQVKETPCDGSGPEPPAYNVTKAVTRRTDCPPTTAMYVELTGGAQRVGCARRL